ncbi:RsmD family RNA methyltransferase [Myxococcota bacterium]|nr:RsmD family RNA methyltransferase [Myxococcota bacterium]
MNKRHERTGDEGAVLEVNVHALDELARGVGETDDGAEVRVAGVLPGERVRVEVEFVDRHQRRHARLASVLAPSSDRVPAGCPHHPSCPEAALLHASFAAQYRWKRAQLLGALELDESKLADVVPCPRPFGYEARVRLMVADDGTIGVVRPKIDGVSDMSGCVVHAPEVERIVDAIRSLMQRSAQPITGLRALQVVASLSEGRALVTLVTRSGAVGVDALASVLGMRSDVAWLGRVTNDGVKDEAFWDADAEVLQDRGPVFEAFGATKHVLVPSGVTPVSPLAAVKLHEMIVALGAPSGEEVLDLYSGSGAISLAVAAAGASRVVGIEANPRAVEASRSSLAENAELGSRVTLLEGSAEDGTLQLASAGERFGLVVLDPPKKGASRDVLETMAELAAKKIAYVGRDPKVLARDLANLHDVGFDVERVVPIDVAPHSAEHEALVILARP